MVVQSSALDLGHLGLFLGLRVNALVVARMTAAGFAHVRESHGYVIQHLIDADRTITELAVRMEVSQQAASKSVGELIGLGVLEASPGADRRAKRIRLSARGRQAVEASRRARKTIEARLIKAVGTKDYKSAHLTLARALTALGGMQRVRTRRVRPPA